MVESIRRDQLVLPFDLRGKEAPNLLRPVNVIILWAQKL
jgi:hypothetical protein